MLVGLFVPRPQLFILIAHRVPAAARMAASGSSNRDELLLACRAFYCQLPEKFREENPEDEAALMKYLKEKLNSSRDESSTRQRETIDCDIPKKRKLNKRTPDSSTPSVGDDSSEDDGTLFGRRASTNGRSASLPDSDSDEDEASQAELCDSKPHAQIGQQCALPHQDEAKDLDSRFDSTTKDGIIGDNESTKTALEPSECADSSLADSSSESESERQCELDSASEPSVSKQESRDSATTNVEDPHRDNNTNSRESEDDSPIPETNSNDCSTANNERESVAGTSLLESNKRDAFVVLEYGQRECESNTGIEEVKSSGENSSIASIVGTEYIHYDDSAGVVESETGDLAKVGDHNNLGNPMERISFPEADQEMGVALLESLEDELQCGSNSMAEADVMKPELVCGIQTSTDDGEDSELSWALPSEEGRLNDGRNSPDISVWRDERQPSSGDADTAGCDDEVPCVEVDSEDNCSNEDEAESHLDDTNDDEYVEKIKKKVIYR